jgi:hypothetical protein
VGFACLRQDPARAAAALDQSIALTRLGAGDGVYAQAVVLSAVLACGSGDDETSIALLYEALRYGRDSGNQISVSFAIGFGLIIMAERGDPEVAATLSAAGPGALIKAHGSFAAEYEHTVGRLRRQLGPAVFDAAVAKGAAMSRQQIVAYLLAALPRVGAPIAEQ